MFRKIHDPLAFVEKAILTHRLDLGMVLAGHQKVGDHAKIGAKSGVHKDLPGGGQYLGYPATALRDARKTYALLHRIPEFKRQLEALEAEVKALSENNRESPPAT